MRWRRERTALGLSDVGLECERANRTPWVIGPQGAWCFLTRRGTPGVFKSRACFHSIGVASKRRANNNKRSQQGQASQCSAQTSKEELCLQRR